MIAKLLFPYCAKKDVTFRLEYWHKDDSILSCFECQGSFHLGCCDPPLAPDTWLNLITSGKQFVCPRCTPCRGLTDINRLNVFRWLELRVWISAWCVRIGKRWMLALSNGLTNNISHQQTTIYHEETFCPNCCHTWDDVNFDKNRRQIEWSGSKRGKRADEIVCFCRILLLTWFLDRSPAITKCLLLPM